MEKTIIKKEWVVPKRFRARVRNTGEKSVTPKQIAYLKMLGVQVPELCSNQQAGILISETKKLRSSGAERFYTAEPLRYVSKPRWIDLKDLL